MAQCGPVEVATDYIKDDVKEVITYIIDFDYFL